MRKVLCGRAMAIKRTGFMKQLLMIVADAVTGGFSSEFSVLVAIGVALLVAVGGYIGYRMVHNYEKNKQEELKIRLEREYADKAEELRQSVMAGVGQELVTPITLIIAPLQQMASEPIGDDLRLRVHMILRNAQMLLHQVNILSTGMRPSMVTPVEMQMPPITPPAETADPAETPTQEEGEQLRQTDVADNQEEEKEKDTAASELTGVDDSNAAEAADMTEEKDIEIPTSHRFTMLMVDDSPDMCRFVRDYFRGEYNVITAANGQEAVKCLKEIDDIDLVVSDVAMPKMDGLELCRYVKNDLRWSHIPVILLTGHTEEEMEAEGLKMGADDYITKPFNAEMLRLRVKKLIETKKNRQKLFKEGLNVSPSDLTITSVDELFLQRAIKICEERISDTEFSVEVLGRELSMSRTYLYKKLMNITGKGPAEFIRILRLKQGKQYLDQTNMQITEISAAIGYSSPKRFTENFKAEFGVSPSEYVRMRRLQAEQEAKSTSQN